MHGQEEDKIEVTKHTKMKVVTTTTSAAHATQAAAHTTSADTHGGTTGQAGSIGALDLPSLFPDPKSQRSGQGHHARSKPSSLHRLKKSVLVLKADSLGRLGSRLRDEKKRLQHKVDTLLRDKTLTDTKLASREKDLVRLLNRLECSETRNLNFRDRANKMEAEARDLDSDRTVVKEVERLNLLKRNEVLKVRTQDLLRENQVKDEFIGKSTEAIRMLMAEIQEEKTKSTQSSIIRSRVIEEELQKEAETTMDESTSESKADMELIVSMAAHMQNELCVNKLEIHSISQQHANKEKTLKNEVEELRAQVNKLTALIHSLEGENANLRSGDSDEVRLDPINMSVDQIRGLLEKYTALKVVNKENMKSLKEVEHILTNHINSYSDKDLSVKQLEADLARITGKYDEMKSKIETAINSSVNAKTRQYEQLAKDLSMQVSVLLFENTHLRKYIEKVTGEVVLPMHPDLVSSKNHLSAEEYGLFTNINELIKQNAELKKSLNHGGSLSPMAGRTSSQSSHRLNRSSPQQAPQVQDSNAGAPEGENSTLLKEIESLERLTKKLKEQKESWEQKANEILSDNSELNRRLRALQNEHYLQEQNLKTSEVMVSKLKHEIGIRRTAMVEEGKSDKTYLEAFKLQYQKQIDQLKHELSVARMSIQSQDTLLKAKHAQNVEKIWNLVQISVDEKPLNDSFQQVKCSMDKLVTVAEGLVAKVNESAEKLATTAELGMQVAALKESLNKVTGYYQDKDRFFSQQLDSIAVVVNNMEQEYTKGLPDYFKQISLNSPSLSYTSPTLLCIRLKEEFERVEKEYAQLRSQLSQESTTYVDINNTLTQKVRDQSHELSDLTQKYQKVCLEKDTILQAVHSSERGVFDAIRYKSFAEENEKLKAQVEDLKSQLISEKKIKINELYDGQGSLGRVSQLTQEVNVLTNLRIELMKQLQASEVSKRLKEGEDKLRIEYLERENALLAEKVTKIIQGVESLKRYWHDPESEANKRSLQGVDLSLNALGKDLERVKAEYLSRSQLISREISGKIDGLAHHVGKKTEELLDIVGKSDQTYKQEIETLKKEVDKLLKHKDGLANELSTAKHSEGAMNKKVKELQDKIYTFENAEDTKGPWYDGNIDISGSMDLERVTKALKKSLELIATLQAKVESLAKKN